MRSDSTNGAGRAAPQPAPLVVAASLTVVEGGAIALYGAAEFAHVSSGRLAMGLTTGVFFAAYGAGLMALAFALSRAQSWARAPVLLSQLLQGGVALSFWGGVTTWVSVVLIVVALVTIAGVLHPASLDALDPE